MKCVKYLFEYFFYKLRFIFSSVFLMAAKYFLKKLVQLEHATNKNVVAFFIIISFYSNFSLE